MKKLLILALAVVLMAVVAQADTLLHYDFSNGSGTTVTDLSGHSNNGTLNGFVNTGAGAGQFGVSEGWVTDGGLSIMQGDSHRSYVTTNLGIGTITGDWTIEYQANADVSYEYAPAVTSSVHWSSGVFVGLHHASNSVLVAGHTGDTSTSPYTLPGDQSDPSIHHIAMVYDVATQTVECFVDGLSTGTATGIPALTGAPGEVFWIGNSYWNANEQWDGVLYGIAISNTKLGPDSFVLVSGITGKATAPSPANGATSVSTTADLSWTAGSEAISHDVYFGTTSPGTFRCNQSGTTYDTGTMAYNTVYYWRINEVDAGGTTIGTVWHFTTGAAPAVKASNPSPTNTTGAVSIDADLSWTAGAYAVSHDVYFGTSQAAVTAASRLAGDINGSGSVDIDDIAVLAQQWLGTPVEPYADLDGDDDVNLADFAVVSADWLDSADSVFKGNQTGTTFEPGTMAYNTTYYWRIDEVNSTEPQSPWTGQVWSFTTRSENPVGIIFDTDIGTDIDDAGAMAILHKLAAMGEAEILATITSNSNTNCPVAIDVINTWYGQSQIPIASSRTGPGPEYWYHEDIPNYPHSISGPDDVPAPVDLYREILAAQPDNSVKIVVVGWLTDIAELLDSGPDIHSSLNGQELVAAKVTELIAMGGEWPNTPPGEGEYNFHMDGPAAYKVITEWPGKIMFTGLGRAVLTGQRLMEETTNEDPVRAFYENFFISYGGTQRSSWDLIAVLYAVRSLGDYFTAVTDGYAAVNTQGSTTWITTGQISNQGYLVYEMPTGELAEILDELMLPD